MRTIAKQIAAMFICLIAMLSVFSTVAYADWTGSFGGAGGSGTVGSGYWLEARVQRVACLVAWEIGGPPRVGPGWSLVAGCKAGSEVGSAPCNSPPGGGWRPGSWSPWELRRCDALRGIGL